jgi:hypothetical protein
MRPWLSAAASSMALASSAVKASSHAVSRRLSCSPSSQPLHGCGEAHQWAGRMLLGARTLRPGQSGS